jgi:hypothetical protein
MIRTVFPAKALVYLMTIEDDLLYFNGVNASSGAYGMQPMSVADLSRMIRGEKLDDKAALNELKTRTNNPGHFAVKQGVDDTQLNQAGWAVIFPKGGDPRVRENLKALLDMRRAQAGKLYREFGGDNGYSFGEDKNSFLERLGAATSGPVDPERLPYYLLLVASPEEIPYRLQYQLDVQYAVGRIYFDQLEDYARYAASVIAAEQGWARLARRMAFVGVQNPGDAATRLSTDFLVTPLVEQLRTSPTAEGWQFDTILRDDAHKARVIKLLGGNETPALLFTASHGVEFENGDPRQVDDQGALLCGDWPGREQWGDKPIPNEHYVAARDIPDDARLLGTVCFHFACFGAGTPRLDDFPHQRGAARAIAPHAFVARLPQRLLAHPNGGALAVIGHVERAWGYSFLGNQAPQIETFSSTIRRLMVAGTPVGRAVEDFNNRYAELATVLTERLEDIRMGKKADDRDLSRKWIEHNDARSYVVIGDPAVRLPLANNASEIDARRPTIASVRSAHSGTVTASQAIAEAAAKQQAADAAAQAAAEAALLAEEARREAERLAAQAGGAVDGTTAVGAAASVQVGDMEASFGLFGSGEGLKEIQQNLVNTLQNFTSQLGETMKRAINDAAHLEVETYVADDIATVKYREGDYTGAELRAVTRMSLDGDTKVIIPARDGDFDERIWQIHTEMVAKAQANRAEMLRSIASAAANLFAALSGKS